MDLRSLFQLDHSRLYAHSISFITCKSIPVFRRIHIDTIVSAAHSLLYHNRLATFAGDADYALAIFQAVINLMAVGTTNASRA